MNRKHANHTVVCGAGPDTGNQGVTALCYSLVHGLASRNIHSIEVLDHGRGRRADRVELGALSIDFERLGAINSRRYYRAENLWQIRAAARLGGLWNETARSLRSARAVLDVSGGDSFTEIYGARRLRTVTLPKLTTLEAGRPLILLPQTYGPFQSDEALALAARLARGATAAWARDVESFEQLRRLLGSEFDPERHHLGVDMAFGLPVRRPESRLDRRQSRWLSASSPSHPLIGFNISGLLYQQAEQAQKQFGLRSNYRTTIVAALRRLVNTTDARILLVPHVVVNRPGAECDLAACHAVARELGEPERVSVLTGSFDAAELKLVIGRMDWFCGTRMHATIAGLSSGVPTLALAYSMKTRGVFASCGQADEVLDLRTCDSQVIAERIVDSWQRRADTRQALARALPAVKSRVALQMDHIADAVRLSGDIASSLSARFEQKFQARCQ